MAIKCQKYQISSYFCKINKLVSQKNLLFASALASISNNLLGKENMQNSQKVANMANKRQKYQILNLLKVS